MQCYFHEVEDIVLRNNQSGVFVVRDLFVLQQQQNLGRRFGTSKMHSIVALAAVRSKAVVLLLLIRC